MEIIVKKYTDVDLLREACEMTMHKKRSKATLKGIYKCEHSPARTQMFWVKMLGIPTFVSVHLVRHKFGVEHFVVSNRDDRGGSDCVDRDTPVDHGMWINAQELVFMARKRLCLCSHPKTVEVMEAIVRAVSAIDVDLSNCMVPDCIYRGGRCNELRSCGYIDSRVGQVNLSKYNSL